MAAVSPETSRLSRSLQSGAGGLRWPDQCCLLLSAQSVLAAENTQDVKLYLNTRQHFIS